MENHSGGFPFFINFLERGEEEEEDIRKGSGSRVMDKDSKK